MPRFFIDLPEFEGFQNEIERPIFGFGVYSSDVFAKHAKENELQAADQQRGYEEERPARHPIAGEDPADERIADPDA